MAPQALRVVSLDVENIMRLKAAFVTIDAADGPIVTVGGLNGHGKTSLITAIAMALGGKALCPPEPLRAGQLEGHVLIDLGDYLVTRRFWRRALDAPIESSLVVSSPDGKATYKSPQSLLDKLVSDLTFDPLAFLDLQPAAQREFVRAFTGLDFTELDADRRRALAHVAEAETTVKLAERAVDDGDHYPEAPSAPVSVEDLLEQLAVAERADKGAAQAEAAVAEQDRAIMAADKTIGERLALIDRLTTDLAKAKMALDTDRQYSRMLASRQDELRKVSGAARAAVPDTAALRQQLANAQTANRHVAANVRYAGQVAAADEARRTLADRKAAIAAIDQQKRSQLEAATFPVPGLGFSEDGLTFDGLPFEQASYAQQLRVAVAMAMAEKPTLKIVLIKHGNALDRHSLALLTTLAQEHGLQVWLERVTESPAGVSVFIEDGAVRIDDEVTA